jgi:OOP family OmpA-OmpF porin
MKNILITLMALSAGLVNAQTVDNWVNASGTPWKNSTGQCWRNSSWTPATAHQDCDGALKPPVVASVTKPAQVDITKPTATIAQAAATPPAITKTTYQADTLFDFDKSVLKPEGKAKLDELITKIRNVSLEVIIVVGHTDSVGTDAYNMKLGDRRAQTVKAYFVSKGIERNRVYTESKGESQPIADNKTAVGRAKNRRVEIEVVGTTK